MAYLILCQEIKQSCQFYNETNPNDYISKAKLSRRRVYMILIFVCEDTLHKEIQKITEASQCSCQQPERKEISDCDRQEAYLLIFINYL